MRSGPVFRDPVERKVLCLGLQLLGKHVGRDVLEKVPTDAGEQGRGGNVEVFGDTLDRG